MASDSQETASNTATDSQTGAEAGGLGFSNAASVKITFSASPIHKLELANVESVYFNGGNHGGNEVDGLNGIVQNGHGFSEAVDLNYTAAPTMVIAGAGGAGGAPANAYVPNPSSPGGVIGVPNDNPTQKPAPPPSFVNMKGSGGAQGGGPAMVDAEGLPIKPSDTSALISTSEKRPGASGESSWTVSQKLNSQTPVNPAEG